MVAPPADALRVCGSGATTRPCGRPGVPEKPADQSSGPKASGKGAREPDHRGAYNRSLDGWVLAISIRAGNEGKPMLFKRFRRAVEPSPGKWKRIEETPVPLSLGRIWLVDQDGSITRAMAFTWPILKRREPRKYRFWMSREPHAREPAAEAVAALKALRAK